MTEEEYKVYWDDYVWPRWREHGSSRLGCINSSKTLRLDCIEDIQANVHKVVGFWHI